jgi:hypothetical protein
LKEYQQAVRYRQDCNFAISPFWAQADASDRQGITEIRYVEGLLEFWDELRPRHSQLILNIVQRGDLESISRGVDLVAQTTRFRPMRIPLEINSALKASHWRPHF